MELTIDKAGEVIEYCRTKISEVENNQDLSEQGKLNQFKELSSNIDKQLAAWKSEVSNAQMKLKEELASKKPPVVKRDLTKENLGSLKYLSKTLISQTVAEGNTIGELRGILGNALKEGDSMTLQAYVDNFTDFIHSLAGKDYDSARVLTEYYHEFKRKLKTPEQLAYEDAEKELLQKSNELNNKIYTVERNFDGIKKTLNRYTWGGAWK